MKFIYRLFCSHYFDNGVALNKETQFGMHTFICDKCGTKIVRMWNYAINYNAWRI